MGRLIDLTGQLIGGVRIIGRVSNAHKSGQARWLFVCVCGSRHVAASSDIRNSASPSCGCRKGSNISTAKIKHGDAKANGPAPEYRIWAKMLRRTRNPRDHAWKDYGERGISVCERWSTYENFLADMGRRPSPIHSLDRIDNNGPYSRDNCRWATKSQQARNRRSSTSVCWRGKTRTVADWAELTGLHAGTITTRLRNGWSVDRALSTPAGPDPRKPKRDTYLREIEGRREAAE